MLINTLNTLRDIQGIQGSFIVASTSGQILARDLPSVIDDASLNQVGPRICRLMDVIEAEQPTESAALRFAEHRIDVRSMGAALLCVMADARVNQPALRMAIKLVCRKLESHEWSPVEEEMLLVEPNLEEDPAPITSKSSAAGAKPAAYRVYRGTRYPV
jgi:predicted regulator of Ras-like GTPase activity (Roadblock/LC7/MglB family)